VESPRHLREHLDDAHGQHCASRRTSVDPTWTASRTSSIVVHVHVHVHDDVYVYDDREISEEDRSLQLK
jgi:hypothetical protein